MGRSKRRASSPGGCHGPWRTSRDPQNTFAESTTHRRAARNRRRHSSSSFPRVRHVDVPFDPIPLLDRRDPCLCPVQHGPFNHRLLGWRDPSTVLQCPPFQRSSDSGPRAHLDESTAPVATGSPTCRKGCVVWIGHIVRPCGEMACPRVERHVLGIGSYKSKTPSSFWHAVLESATLVQCEAPNQP